MQKKILTLFFVMICLTQSKAQQRLFNQSVQLKSCNITIDANPFIATTFVEMEFYNPKDQEVEGFQSFELNRGQVITGFQLELNGKYREGSIEERWKANRAYSSIVGKRIDPAILDMSWQDHYNIHIYPIAAKSSRKISFTITQLMKEDSSKLTYELPLHFTGTTDNFKLDIKFNDAPSAAYSNYGLLQNMMFNANNNISSLSWKTQEIILNKPISFSVDRRNSQPQLCITQQNGQASFVMRLYPDVPVYYNVKPKTLKVYWDVSTSSKNRNIEKEIEFLEKYIAVNEISTTSITFFNQQLKETLLYTTGKDDFSGLKSYLLRYKYGGATELSNLNFAVVNADAILLFSDGINSIGKKSPVPGSVQVNCITSAAENDYVNLNSIVGTSGGSVINLKYSAVADAVKRLDKAENFLARYNASSMNINENLPISLGKSILLTGSIHQAGNLQLFYGNNGTINKTENYFLPATGNCEGEVYKKMMMLKAYDSVMYGNDYYKWQNMVVFGLTEKVVTLQTSFLVLERVEDYVKYKIAPPKELEEECAQMNYVYKSEYKIRALREYTEQEALQAVITEYNKRISWWNKNETLIDITRQAPVQKNDNPTVVANEENKRVVNTMTISQNDFKGGATDMKEVVVTGAFGTRRVSRALSSNVQVVSYDQLNTIRQSNINDAMAGKIAGMQVRSQSAAKLGMESMVRLRGENGFGVGTGPIYVVDGTILPSSSDINPDNIEDVTVLQGPSSTALFGPDGVNGAIVMNSKKGRRTYDYPVWGEYKLSSVEDVDYIKEMQQASYNEMWETYKELEEQNSTNIGFYFDMAEYFFQQKSEVKAEDILYTGIELCKGNASGLKLAAYILEDWKKFDKAIEVYKGILSVNDKDIQAKRDLALAYFQHKDYADAVRTYYAIITATSSDDDFSNIKENALAEMNAIIALHKNDLDISYINKNLIKALPVDLRITVETNYNYVNRLQVVEPGDEVCNADHPNTKNGGRFSSGYNYYVASQIGEYAVKNAMKGKYRIKINADQYYSYNVPMYLRIVVFKNFQADNVELEVRNINLANQYGVVEVDEVKW